ncbi:MAG: NUDIX domain-containing protein [Chlamydiia bacterium]|nr:NUDIX domain-containing protein [Chlamydiia bacterium]
MAEVFETKPKDFHSEKDVAACYVTCKNRFLLLKRAPDKPQPETWGVPAGKFESEETPDEAVIREVLEEVGLHVTPTHLGELYVKHPDLHFTYHMFHHHFDAFPEVILSPEHTEFVWATYEEALSLPLIGGGKDALAHYHKILSNKA